MSLRLNPHQRAALIRHQAGSNGKKKTGHSGSITPGFQAPTPRSCQWLEGEAKHRNFCGAPAKPGSSYCHAHHARCWIKPIDRRTSKSKDPKKRGRLSLAIPT